MCSWQIERRKRTRHLIELGGLVVKAGVVALTGDDRAVIFGALLWMAEKLQSEQGRACAKTLGRRGEKGVRGGLKRRSDHASALFGGGLVNHIGSARRRSRLALMN